MRSRILKQDKDQWSVATRKLWDSQKNDVHQRSFPGELNLGAVLGVCNKCKQEFIGNVGRCHCYVCLKSF